MEAVICAAVWDRPFESIWEKAAIMEGKSVGEGDPWPVSPKGPGCEADPAEG